MNNVIQALPYHCVPACICMILQDILPSLEQDSVGRYLGVVTDDDNDINIGTRIQTATLNKLLDDLSIGDKYCFEYFKANDYEEWRFEELLIGELSAGSRLICCLSAGRLYGNDEVDLGHAVVITDYVSGIAVVADPGPKNYGMREFDIETLFAAARFRKGGLICLRTLESPLDE
ncbi:hypothetical protein [Aeromonas sp. FDAARGOS 1418]|uniref:hypothetical protein n=1 Tax=Aeromonas sp. FDAARGOS 1418 TaxID=2778067 RepID=UPI001C219B1D|nr:hypothetical protein [Aeromonas sp. FDAARGOS 1418]QXC00208.1 hypothetical protein I6L48_04630 [Aeromonas sp. FDAARGOS 1418]